jgi:hypothetical protein
MLAHHFRLVGRLFLNGRRSVRWRGGGGVLGGQSQTSHRHGAARPLLRLPRREHHPGYAKHCKRPSNCAAPLRFAPRRAAPPYRHHTLHSHATTFLKMNYTLALGWVRAGEGGGGGRGGTEGGQQAPWAPTPPRPPDPPPRPPSGPEARAHSTTRGCGVRPVTPYASALAASSVRASSAPP